MRTQNTNPWARALLIRACAAGGALLAAQGAPAHAEDLLRGPHPFLKDNELSLHTGYQAGLGDSQGGWKALVDYGYKIQGSWWLDLLLGYQSQGCQGATGGLCGGSRSAEVMAGVKWKLRTEIPLVPYAKAAAGFLYVFPDDIKSAAGIAVRGGIGAKYFLYDWLGVGAETTMLVGHPGFPSGSGVPATVHTLDLILGVELQF